MSPYKFVFKLTVHDHLFLVSPAYGHLNRSFSVARQLQADGYTIVYGHFGSQDLARRIQQQGFALHWMQTVPFGVGLDELQHKGKHESYLETLLDRITKRTFYARTARPIAGIALSMSGWGVAWQVASNVGCAIYVGSH